jgi:hypothetical protein
MARDRCTNSVVLGFTGTPLCDKPSEAADLKAIIKGRENAELNDEGFVSYAEIYIYIHRAIYIRRGLRLVRRDLYIYTGLYI